MRPKDEHKEERIKQACIALIYDCGIEGISAGKISEKAKVSSATIYIYFESMVNMYRTINEEILIEYFTSISERLNDKKSIKENFYNLWDGAYDYCSQNPKKFIFTTRMINSCIVNPSGSDIEPYHLSISRFLDQGIEDNTLKPLSVISFILVAFSPLYGLLKAHIERNTNIETPVKALLKQAAWDAVKQ